MFVAAISFWMHRTGKMILVTLLRGENQGVGSQSVLHLKTFDEFKYCRFSMPYMASALNNKQCCRH